MIILKLMPVDFFVVYNKANLNVNDQNNLMLLYQPIVGSDAIGIYYTLYSLVNDVIVSKEKSHHYLMAVTHLSLERISKAREKLEAIGLLKSYYKKSDINQYVYELYSPLQINDFFENPLLTATLKKHLGSKEFNQLIDFFSVEPVVLTDYQEISAEFKDIFSVTADDTITANFSEKESLELTIDYGIEIDKLLSFISDDILNHHIISNEDKIYLKRLSYIYDIDEEIFKELIINSINQYKKIDLLKLRKKCESFFQYENKGKLPSIAYKKQPEDLQTKSKEVTNRMKMINFFETTSPRDFIFLKNDKTVISENEKKILTYLLLDLKLNPGVVNVLIDYVLRINEQKLTKNFVEAIALQWKRAKVKTVPEAMDLAEKEYRQRKELKGKGSRPTKKEKLPEWFNKEIAEKVPDKNRQKEIDELLKEYV